MLFNESPWWYWYLGTPTRLEQKLLEDDEFIREHLVFNAKEDYERQRFHALVYIIAIGVVGIFILLIGYAFTGEIRRDLLLAVLIGVVILGSACAVWWWRRIQATARVHANLVVTSGNPAILKSSLDFLLWALREATTYDEQERAALLTRNKEEVDLFLRSSEVQEKAQIINARMISQEAYSSAHAGLQRLSADFVKRIL